MSTELIERPRPQTAAESVFQVKTRTAKAMSMSTLVPEAYRGDKNLGNVMIALELAERIGASPLQIMQSLHVIQGRPSWSASFLIGTVNASGRFTPLRFEIEGGDDPSAESYRVRAFAEDVKSGRRCVGEWITWAMVKAEGWASKAGSKWKTMPGQMFMYRAAAFWTRVYAPELSLGLHTTDELQDVFGGTDRIVPLAPTEPSSIRQLEAQLRGEPEPAETVDTATGEVTQAEPARDPDTGEILPAEYQ